MAMYTQFAYPDLVGAMSGKDYTEDAMHRVLLYASAIDWMTGSTRNEVAIQPVHPVLSRQAPNEAGTVVSLHAGKDDPMEDLMFWDDYFESTNRQVGQLENMSFHREHVEMLVAAFLLHELPRV